MKLKYDTIIHKEIVDLLLQDTFTIHEICDMKQISCYTYHNWIKKYASFSNDIKKARESCRARLAKRAKNSLERLIDGVDTKEIKTKNWVDRKTKEEFADVEVTQKTGRPDTTAVIFALCNLDPENWKNRQTQQIEMSNTDALSIDDINNGMKDLDDDELRVFLKASKKIKDSSIRKDLDANI